MQVTTKYGFLERGLTLGASDWQLCPGTPAAFRAQGDYVFDPEPLPAEAFAEFIAQAAPPNRDHYDGSFDYGTDRFRISLFQSQEGPCATLRHLPSTIRPLAELEIPTTFLDLLASLSGLVIVTGPTGSGKSATLASMVDDLNRTRAGAIVTLENPIEYRHTSKKSVVRQRELGTHFPSFADGIKAALRQDPDVIMVGEMRDPETISAALTAAETGHLVLATMHTGTAAGAVTRILDAAPANDAPQQRSILAKSLRAVLAQQLVPTLDGNRCAALEILTNTLAVENCIRTSRFEHIGDEIARGGRHGMTTMDASLEILARSRRISRETALSAARDRSGLASRLGPNL